MTEKKKTPPTAGVRKFFQSNGTDEARADIGRNGFDLSIAELNDDLRSNVVGAQCKQPLGAVVHVTSHQDVPFDGACGYRRLVSPEELVLQLTERAKCSTVSTKTQVTKQKCRVRLERRGLVKKESN